MRLWIAPVIAGLIAASALGGYKTATIRRDDARTYAQWRETALHQEAVNATGPHVLLLGDSIAERADLRELGGVPVFNAAIASSRLDTAAKLGPPLASTLRSPMIVIAIGINDSTRGSETDPNAWAKEFSALLTALHGRRLCLASILPTQNKQPYADTFSAQAASRLNAKLAGLARQHGATLIPAFPVDTVDGVHPSASVAKAWREAVQSHC